MKYRLRFAPSPTGPLHIGGVRTALFNYLFAKKHGGDFILRIEDTDQTRYVQGAENYIVEALKWCNIEFDESVEKGGEFAPYKQSERRETYKKHIEILLEKGKAYYAFDTPEELNAMRERLQAEKSSIQHYNFATRTGMKNSFTLSKEEVEQKIANGEPYVVRFNMPENETIKINDLIRGEITINTSTLDDKVLFKADGLPTYHLANIVDDHLMQISHVIRGEEWLPSLPLHTLLYNSFGWDAPQFAHLPLILKPNGKGKLSKRDGDKLGFPVFPIDWFAPETNEKSAGYKEWGYFSDAFINMLALLGWNPGTEQEIFTMDELIANFDLKKVQKGGAKFDPDKTKWFNQQYLKNKSNSELAQLFMPILKEKGIEKDLEYVEKVVGLIKERATFVADFWELSNFFFEAPTEFNKKSKKKAWKTGTAEIIAELKQILEKIEDFSSENTETEVKSWIAAKELGFGKVLNPLRLLLVGATSGPHLFDIVEMLGKQEVLKRIDFGTEKLSN